MSTKPQGRTRPGLRVKWIIFLKYCHKFWKSLFDFFMRFMTTEQLY